MVFSFSEPTVPLVSFQVISLVSSASVVKYCKFILLNVSLSNLHSLHLFLILFISASNDFFKFSISASIFLTDVVFSILPLKLLKSVDSLTNSRSSPRLSFSLVVF